MKTVATYSIKGGVGKTTAAVNLADAAARSGWRVLLWDVDPQGAATFFLRIKPSMRGGAERLIGKKGELASHIRATDRTGLDVVPADFSLRHLDLHLDAVKRPRERLAELLDPLAADYDLALLDCPPGVTLSSESVFGAVDALLVPTIPTPLSHRTLRQLDRFLADADRRPLMLPFVSMADRRKRLQRDLTDELLAEPGMLPTVIPNASVVEQMGTHRAPLHDFAPRAAATRAFDDLWTDIAAVLDG